MWAPVMKLALFLGFISGIYAAGQNGKPAVISPEPPKAQPPSDFKVPLITENLRLSDFAGMEPRADLKGKLTEVTGFIQQTPNDGQPARSRRRSGWATPRPCSTLCLFAMITGRSRFADILRGAKTY